ncbi:MAG: arylsulfatase [Verrucomicrobiaceae bacterium]|nr:MAG: arylsulfatase [Verrucomicrobiaceae bacterium]
MTSRLLTFFLLLWGGAPAAVHAAEAAPARPNVVIIYADDQGYADLGVQGAAGFRTPNIDRMAMEGRRFTDFYVAAPVCSASRAALLTGCYPTRVGITGALPPHSKTGLNPEEMTLAEVLKTQGYSTAALGKWHLGDHPDLLPVRQGFDEYLGLPYSNDMWPDNPDIGNRRWPPLPLIENDRILDPAVNADTQASLTTRYAERAVDFIRRKKDQPFFLYIAPAMPHVPLYVSDKFQGKSAQGAYGDVIQEIDWAVGQVLTTLKEQGLDDKTLVIYTSDNGPWTVYGNHAGSAVPLREAKGTCWEGGIRVPFVARWPGTIPAGTICREPVCTIDILPTLARLSGAALPPKKIDGLDILPLLTGEPGAKSPHEALYFYYENNQLQALRSGPWKLILPHQYRVVSQFGNNGARGAYVQKKSGTELYNLVTDPSESKDLAAAEPATVTRLLALAEQSRNDLGDTLTRNGPGPGARPAAQVAWPEKGL